MNMRRLLVPALAGVPEIAEALALFSGAAPAVVYESPPQSGRSPG